MENTDTQKTCEPAYSSSRSAACSAVEVKNWTATDAQNALMVVDKNGRQFQVNAIGWDGTVHVAASDTIKPDQRDGWRLFVIQQNAQMEARDE